MSQHSINQTFIYLFYVYNQIVCVNVFLYYFILHASYCKHKAFLYSYSSETTIQLMSVYILYAIRNYYLIQDEGF